MIDIEHYAAQVAAFRTDATGVAELHIGRLGAIADERAAAAELLSWIMEEIRPALPVLGGNIYEHWDVTTRRGMTFIERGVALLGGSQRNGDRWDGKQLVLFIPAGEDELPHALLARLTFSGPVTTTILATRTWLTDEQVLQEWPAERLLPALHDRLLEELEGKAVDKRDDAETRTRKLRAVLELL